MEQENYKLLLTGEIFQGQKIDEVMTKVAKLLHVDLKQCESMFRKRGFVLKYGLKYKSANYYKGIFEKTGACCTIVESGKTNRNMQSSQGSTEQIDSKPTIKELENDSKNQEHNKTNKGTTNNETGKTSVKTSHIPTRIRELIHENESILYASRPSKNALTIAMIFNGIIYGSIGLFLYIVGILFLLPAALLITYFSWKNKYYLVTDSRTIVAQGIFNHATKIINNKNIHIISINTGIVDRWLKLNSIELSTAGQGGAGVGIMAAFPFLSKGSVTLKQVEVKDVIKHYADIAN